MVKEETWSVSFDRVRAFFQEQADVAETERGFAYGSCHIQLTDLPPKSGGIWAARRTKVRMEGAELDVDTIYHRFLIQFLSAGG